MSDRTPVGTIRPLGYGEVASAGPTDSLAELGLRPDPVRRGRNGGRRRSERRRRGWGSRLLRLVALLVLATVGYYVVSLAQVYSAGRSDQTAPVDAIVVMGAAQYDGRPSPQLAARLDHAAALYAEGRAELVVVTGGKQPADRFTEAEASAAYLEERGVPPEALLLENDGRNSYQSLEGVRDLLAARGLERVLIVTDPYHSLRSRLIAQELGLTAYVSPTPTSVVTGGTNVRRHLIEAAGVAVGRIIGFDAV